VRTEEGVCCFEKRESKAKLNVFGTFGIVQMKMMTECPNGDGQRRMRRDGLR
jgi:hypothetical protein